MAFGLRAMRYWRSLLNAPVMRNRGFATAAASDAAHHSRTRLGMSGEYVPVYVVMGMVMIAMTIGTHTAKQQLVHSPAVHVSKKKRESIPEVEDPDRVMASADKFVNKSFLRKVAAIQDPKRTLPDSTQPDPFARPRNADTLKAVGVDPSHPH